MIVVGIVIALLLVWLILVIRWRLGEVASQLYDVWFELADIGKTLKEEPGVKLADEVVAKLRVFAAREFASITDDPAKAYEDGLRDGTTATAQYVLDELKEEE